MCFVRHIFKIGSSPTNQDEFQKILLAFEFDITDL